MNYIKPTVFATSLMLGGCPNVSAEETSVTEVVVIEEAITDEDLSKHPEQTWGLAAVVRNASVPYKNPENSSNVTTFIPMMYFENDYVFLDGLSGGVYLFNDESSDWTLSLLSRMRFVDIPAEYQNALEMDTNDLGLQARYQYSDNWSVQTDVMSDKEGNWYATLGTKGEFVFEDFMVEPHFSLRYKSKDFNSVYYGLKDLGGHEGVGFDIDAGVDYVMGVQANYHVVSNLYLLGAANLHVLDNNAANSPVIKDQVQGEYFLGFGFFNDKHKPRKSELSNKPYVRIAHGWGTPSNLGDILGFNVEQDPYNSQLTSIFYGYPLTDELFGLPFDVYLTPGFVWHWSHAAQASSPEYVVGIKVYYTVEWPVKWRFGVAEGMSYVSHVTNLERTEFEEKGYDNAPHLLNYLDFSFDVNLGDMFNARAMDNVWLGYSIHHRSAIFEKSSQYGRVKGGSNYNTIYLQFDF